MGVVGGGVEGAGRLVRLALFSLLLFGWSWIRGGEADDEGE